MMDNDDDDSDDKKPSATIAAASSSSVEVEPPATSSANGSGDDNNNNNNDSLFSGEQKDDDIDDDIDDDEDDNNNDNDDDDSSFHDVESQHSNAVRIWMTPHLPSVQSELRSLSTVDRQKVWDDLMGPACSGRRQQLQQQLQQTRMRMRMMNGLSLNDDGDENDEQDLQRRRVWGIDDRPEANSISLETPELIDTSLQELQRHVLPMLSFGNTALRQTYQQNPSYIDNSKFQLAFLRSERFHAKNASIRMMKHFDMKPKLFCGGGGGGSNNSNLSILGRDIRQSDLSEDDLEALHAGFTQLSPYKDRHGRSVGINTLKLMNFQSISNVYRVRWYMLMVAIQDEETQKNGFIQVQNYLVPPANQLDKKLDLEFMRGMKELLDAVPLYLVAHYIETVDTFTSRIANSVLKAIPSSLGLRTRLITGSYQECLYDLMCLGVPVPAITTATESLQAHEEWIRIQKEREEGSKRRRITSPHDTYDDDNDTAATDQKKMATSS